MFLISQAVMTILPLNFIDFDKLWTLSCFRESHRGIDFYVKKFVRSTFVLRWRPVEYMESRLIEKGFRNQHAKKPGKPLIGSRKPTSGQVPVTFSVECIPATWNSQPGFQTKWWSCPCPSFYPLILRPLCKLLIQDPAILCLLPALHRLGIWTSCY